MEMFDMKVTNGSNSTATQGPSVVELITFAAFSWSAIVLILIIIAVWQRFMKAFRGTNFNMYAGICRGTDDDGDKDNFWTRCSGTVAVVGVIAAVTAVLLVVGSVLSTQNGDSTGLSPEGIAGRVLLILTEVIALVICALFIAAIIYTFITGCCCEEDDKCQDGTAWIAVFGCAIGTLIGTLFVIGVALLGWSSFEFDTIQGNGSNSTVTPGLHIAGVVFSGVSVGVSVGIPILLLTLISCVLRFLLCDDDVCISRAKEWLTVCRCLSRAKEWLTDCGCLSRAKEWLTEAWENRKVTKAIEARQQLSKSLLEEALKHGSVECRTVVCLLVGVAGAGKTHMKHILLGKKLPKSRTSTPLAEKPVQAVRVCATNGKLQEVTPNQLDKRVANSVALGVTKRTTFFHKILHCDCFENRNQISSPSHLVGRSRSSYDTFERSPTRCCCCSAPPDSELQEITKSLLDKTASRVSGASASQCRRLDDDWIYLIDSGGQIEFLEVLPAFLRHISVCLFFTKLSEMLSEHPKIEYFEDGQLVCKPTRCPFTNEEMLIRCVQMIQCTHQDGSTNQGSKLVMVGTHRDLEHKIESREKKNQTLRSMLCPDFDQSLVFRGQNMNEVIFPINAKNPGPQDHEVANELTDIIAKTISSLKPLKTPISWFQFEQLMQKLARGYRRRFLCWTECLQVARLLHLTKNTLNAALDHLASLGVIHYYPHLLPDVVFADPQFLLDKISELVKFHYKLKYTADPKTPIGGEWREFRDDGYITLELLEQFPESYTNFFTAADFLKLLNDRLIITKLISGDKHFMPCLLRTMESQEVGRYRVTSGVVPLAIHFSCKLVPHGVFCSLVAFLRSRSPCWNLSFCPEDNTKPLCLTRNCIKFQLPEDNPGSLTLIDAFSHFEVHVEASHDVCTRLCPLVWHTLVEGIQKAAETLNYQLVPKLAFLCKHENTRPHIALPNNAFTYWKCEQNKDTSGKLTKEHKVWKGLTEPTQSVQHDLSGAKVKSKLDSPEYKAFQRHLAVLSDGISDPGWLATQLYSRDMISRDMRRESELETTPAPTRTRKLLSAVEDQILTSPEPKFGDFLYILHSEPALDHLARKLEETCMLLDPKEDVQLQPPMMEPDSGVNAGAATEAAHPKPVCQHQRPVTEAAQLNRVSQYQRLQEPEEKVHIPFETHSEMNEGAQTLKEVRITMEALSTEMQPPTAEVQTVLEVHSELDEDCPTVLDCITFQGRERTINIPGEIGSNYSQFGILLLNDPNGTRVSNIEYKHRGDAVQINTEILQEWATRKGKKPVSWKTLTEVLHNIGLGALASEIEVMKLKPTM